jgi:hypothetical protein
VTRRLDLVIEVLTDHHLNFSDDETLEAATAILKALDEADAEKGRTVRVVKRSRNTAWGDDPQLSYTLAPGETVSHVDHGYASGNQEWLTLVIEGPSYD